MPDRNACAMCTVSRSFSPVLPFQIAFLSPPIRRELFERNGFPAFIIQHYLHVFVFLIQLIQELPAGAAGHSAATAVWSLITESYHPFYTCLTAVNVHIQGGNALRAQVHNAAARLDAEPRIDAPSSLSSAHTTWCAYTNGDTSSGWYSALAL